jgi:glycosyltransferase involved in cell wall biosynthesis
MTVDGASGGRRQGEGPAVTVVMPVYNGRDYLARAIESVMAQSMPDWELVIVDDCSTDDSLAVIGRYLVDPRVVLLRNGENVGVAASRNRALASSRGAYLTFLDQDDEWLPRKLELQLAAMLSHPEIGLLHAEYARIDPASQLMGQARDLPATSFVNPDAPVEVEDVFAEIFVSNDIQPLTSMIRREVLDVVGHFDPSLRGTDDYELWLRIALRYPVGHLRTIVGFWRAHPGQVSNRGYEQLLMRLRAIDTILDRFPDARQRVPAAAFRARMHRLCREVANENLYLLRDYSLARTMFIRSLRYRPTDFAAAGLLVYSLLPEPAREALRQARRTMQGTAPDGAGGKR